MIQLICEIKFQSITIMYMKRKRKNTNRVYLPWNIYFLCLHTLFKYILISKSCQTSLNSPHNITRKSPPSSSSTNINKNGPNPKRFTSTCGSSSSSRRFSHLNFRFSDLYLQIQPTNLPFKIISKSPLKLIGIFFTYTHLL